MNKSSIEWKLKAHSVHTEFAIVESSCDCAYIPDKAVTQFCKSKKFDTVEVKLNRWTMSMKIDFGLGEATPSKSKDDQNEEGS